MRIGIYGGTFDPVHFAHLLLAERTREELELDKVIFVPAGTAPHKQGKKPASGEARYQMLVRALEGDLRFEVSRFEIDSNEVSYTIRTLRYFVQRYPGAELFLLTGSDTLVDIPNWYQPREICQLASLATAQRPGSAVPDFTPFYSLTDSKRVEVFRSQVVKIPLMELSATEIRRRVREGMSIRFMTPETVVEYIEENYLYR